MGFIDSGAVAPNRRVNLGWFERNERLTPRYKSIAPELDQLPRFVSDAVLEEFTDRAHGFGPDHFAPAVSWLKQAAATLRRQRLDIGFDAEEINIKAKKLA